MKERRGKGRRESCSSSERESYGSGKKKKKKKQSKESKRSVTSVKITKQVKSKVKKGRKVKKTKTHKASRRSRERSPLRRPCPESDSKRRERSRSRSSRPRNYEWRGHTRNENRSNEKSENKEKYRVTERRSPPSSPHHRDYRKVFTRSERSQIYRPYSPRKSPEVDVHTTRSKISRRRRKKSRPLRSVHKNTERFEISSPASPRKCTPVKVTTKMPDNETPCPVSSTTPTQSTPLNLNNKGFENSSNRWSSGRSRWDKSRRPSARVEEAKVLRVRIDTNPSPPPLTRCPRGRGRCRSPLAKVQRGAPIMLNNASFLYSSFVKGTAESETKDDPQVLATPSVPVTPSFTSYSSKVSQMLQKMGWLEGAGLGKDNQGRVEIVKIEGNTHRAGLGRRPPEEVLDNNSFGEDLEDYSN